MSATALRVAAALSLAYASGCALLFVLVGFPRHRAEAAWFIAAAATVATLIARGWSSRSLPAAVPDSEAAVRWALLVAVAASILLYLPTLDVGLLSDDFVLLQRAGRGELTSGNDFFRPAPMALWWLVGRFSLPDATALHVLNVVLHGVNAWLVYALGRELAQGRAWAALAAALFLTSPAHTESVVWISALFDVLMTTGTLVLVLASLRGQLGLGLVGLGTALLAKESGVAAAAIALAVAWAAGRSLRTPLIGIGATVAFVAIRVLALPLPGTFLTPPSRYALKELASRAFGALGLPWTATELAAVSPLVFFPWILLAGLLAVVVGSGVSWRRAAIVLSLGAWVLGSIAPVYSYFYVAPTLEGSRYIYLASAGFALLLAELASAAWARRGLQPVLGVSIAIALLCGLVGTWRHQQPWKIAAATRDRVVASAKLTLTNISCESLSVSEIPDAVDGAFVFRNGFAEALAIYGVATPPASPDASCRFVWNDSQGFVRQ